MGTQVPDITGTTDETGELRAARDQKMSSISSGNNVYSSEYKKADITYYNHEQQVKSSTVFLSQFRQIPRAGTQFNGFAYRDTQEVWDKTRAGFWELMTLAKRADLLSMGWIALRRPIP